MPWRWPWSARTTPAASVVNDMELPWIKLGYSEIGVKEAPGKADNPQVLQYYKDVGRPDVKHDEVAWCAAWLGSVLVRCHVPIPPPAEALAAISYEKFGAHLATPTFGCIGVKRRHGGESWSRHVGFVVGANATSICLLGGNTNDEVMIALFPRADFTAFRWPPGQPMVWLPMPASLQAARNVTES
jgi:uncharacterized protein (TIGR02594 family)